MDAKSLYPVLVGGVSIVPLDLGVAEPSYLVQVPGRKPLKADRALHRLLTLMDGHHSLEAIVADDPIDGKDAISLHQLRCVIERELIPAGVVIMGASREASSEQALGIGAPQRWLGVLTAALQHLFSVPVFLMLTPAVVGAHVWLYHELFARSAYLGLSGMTPRDWLLLIALTAAAVLAHELGHLAACRRYCGNHGPLTMRLRGSLPSPVAEVTMAWQCPRRQRLVVDLGGAWLQLVLATLLAVLYVVARSPGIPLAAYLSEFGLLLALLPLPGRDGHWIQRDLAGRTGRESSGSTTGDGRTIALAYQILAAGFFAVSQVMAVVLGLALLRAVRESAFGTSAIPAGILFLALAWLEMRLLSLVAALLAALWARKRTDTATQACPRQAS